MKNLKKIFSLLCLSAAITSGKVNARIVSNIAGGVTGLIGIATILFGQSCLVDPPEVPKEQKKNVPALSKTIMGVGTILTACGAVVIIDNTVNN